MAPILIPGSPLPDLSLPARDDGLHEITTPVVVSLTVILLVFVAENFPPGFTVQVVAVLASEGVTPRPRATAAVAAMAPVSNQPPGRFRMRSARLPFPRPLAGRHWSGAGDGLP